MKLRVSIPPGRALDSLCTEIARDVLEAISSVVELKPTPDHLKALREEALDHFKSWLSLTGHAPDSHVLPFANLEEFERFQADLAALLLCRVGSEIGAKHATALIAREVPLAITRALEPCIEGGSAPVSVPPATGIVRSPHAQWQEFSAT